MSDTDPRFESGYPALCTIPTLVRLCVVVCLLGFNAGMEGLKGMAHGAQGLR